MSRGPAAPVSPVSPVPPTNARPGIALALLPLAGFLLWFVVGLPWGPHIESYDWMVRLDTMSLGRAAFAQLPSVLSLRPLGIALGWIVFRLGGHDVALAQFVNAALTLLAWAWLARATAAPRTFALLALAVGGTCFAGYIYVFHLHGVFYAPLLLFLAALVHLARRPLGPGTLGLVLALAVPGALFHPFALPLAVAFAAGALAESRALRSAAGLGVFAALLGTAAALYLLLVPPFARGPAGDPLAGWRVSFATTEVSRMVSLVAVALAALAARGFAAGAARAVALALALAAAAFCLWRGWPVLPVWIAVTTLACAARGRWALAALLVACAALPAANPMGSPTYAVFAIFVAAAATATTAGVEEKLGWLGARAATALLALALALGIALRAGVPVPFASAVARPLVAERERTLQLPALLRAYVGSDWGGHPLRFARGFDRPVAGDAVDRRFRPPTDDIHLVTWLGHLRNGAPAAGETLFVAFGGDPLVKGEVVLSVHGRVAGDALVFRRAPPGTAGGPANEVHPDERP